MPAIRPFFRRTCGRATRPVGRARRSRNLCSVTNGERRRRSFRRLLVANESFFRLDGRTALVTGGGRGIGEAICRRLASAGARVVVFDLSADNAGSVAKSIGGLAVAGDVASETDITRALVDAERA